MSYEHCEEHDMDATNGCVGCLKAEQDACEHTEALCCNCAKRLTVRAAGSEDNLLRLGWRLQGSSIAKPDKPRETRVVLVNPELGRKVMGFGSDFAEALAAAVKEARL